MGINIKNEDIIKILNKTQHKIYTNNKDEIKIIISPFRQDIKKEIDIIEEIIRIFGYQKIYKYNTTNIIDYKININNTNNINNINNINKIN
jgi:phenylalanyl-tRNA synthetase beta chain